MPSEAENEMQEFLEDFLSLCSDAHLDDELGNELRELMPSGDFPAVEDTQSYSAGGYLTGNAGFVVKLASGSRFHITVVQE